MYLVLVGELFEPFAERLVGIGHDYERRRVDLFDLMLHEVHLLAAHHQEDHVPRSVRIHPLRLDVGRTAVEVFDDEAFERLMVVADDEEQLVVRRTVEQVGDHTRGDINRDERIERQHPAVRSGFARPQPEADDGQAGQHDETVGQEDARRELDAREFLQQHPQLKVVETEDTAGSARDIKEKGLKGHAAICSKYAAELYGMKILQEGIETNKHNFTRFLVVCDPWRADELKNRDKVNKANIVFSLPHSEGSLSQVLSIFSFYKINLTKIQSLPIIGREWEYMFYVDVMFSDYLRYKQAIDAVTPLTKELKILGEYAEGESTL